MLSASLAALRQECRCQQNRKLGSLSCADVVSSGYAEASFVPLLLFAVLLEGLRAGASIDPTSDSGVTYNIY
jgi:hypothetical protein